ncbi:MAG: sodium:calcium symporter [Verrucomicrobiota bacterium]
MERLLEQVEQLGGAWTPLWLLCLFLLSSLLIIWRLELMTRRGVQGIILGTLFMPYFSGLGNLIFVGLVIRDNGQAEEVAINCWTNNFTNLCLLLALPALIWGLKLKPNSRAKKALRESKIIRLSLGLSLVAMAFFSMVVWVLGQDGQIDRFDGITLVGLFLFWQTFQIFEVLKENTRSGSSWHPLILLDSLLILIGSFFTLLALEGIVHAIQSAENGWIRADRLGLLTGWLMVLPNAVLAFYYAALKKAEVVYGSQVGDAHICIPLCLGLFAIARPLPLSAHLQNGLLIISGICLLHLLMVTLFKRLPRLIAALLMSGYGYFLYLEFV